MPRLLALVPVPALITGVVLTGVASAATDSLGPDRLPPCITSGQVPGLTDAQDENARLIVANAEARLGPSAAEIAVMTALTESGLSVLANPHDPSGSAYPSQGVGYDHDSLGLFQQRPSWGTAAARMDPVASTNLFLDALETNSGWRTEMPWQAAQDVQRSAFDGAPSPANGGSTVYGGNYLAKHNRALAIVDAIDASAAHQDCGGTSIPDVAAGGPGPYGLPAGYRVPSSASDAARLAVRFALAQLGKPYRWGGTGPDRFDCSGLTQAAWRAGGHELGRTTWDQATDGVPAALQHIQLGDLVLIPGSDGSVASPSHIGIYIGEGLIAHAPKTGDVIRIATLAGFIERGLSGIRHVA
jgi:peptidoglycan DL-endopeptidase CwlO